LSYRVLDTALSDREVAMLRCATDILIHVPISDVFSAAMLETLYAGGLLITGAWLPYSELRHAHVSFDAIATLDDLPGAVTVALDNGDAKRQAAMANPGCVRALAHPTQTVRTWIDIYDQLLGFHDKRAAP
jgi:hypothetical protein